MAQRLQGLARDNNLSEDLDDGQSLENLAGAGIDQDLFIFINNLRNTSELTWDPNGPESAVISSSTGATNRRFRFGTDIPFTFTTNDKIIKVEVRDNLNVDSDGEYIDDAVVVDETEYFIVDLSLNEGTFNNQRAIALATSEDGTPITIPTAWRTRFVLFTRLDAVVQDNILRIATPEIQNSSQNTGGDIGAASSFSYNIGGDFNSAFELIEERVDIANFKRIQKYSSNASVSSDRDIRLEGIIRSADPDTSLNNPADLGDPIAPGIFITDPFSDITNITSTRAFSTSDNPWDEVTGKLTTLSTQVNIGNLLFDDGIEIDGITVSSNSSTTVASQFTHKLPVVVDGIEYFLCLSNS